MIKLLHVQDWLQLQKAYKPLGALGCELAASSQQALQAIVSTQQRVGQFSIADTGVSTQSV